MAQKYLFKGEIGLIPNGDRTSRYRRSVGLQHGEVSPPEISSTHDDGGKMRMRTMDGRRATESARAAKAHDEKFPTLR